MAIPILQGTGIINRKVDPQRISLLVYNLPVFNRHGEKTKDDRNTVLIDPRLKSSANPKIGFMLVAMTAKS
jgi:hypothetical protein